MTIEELKASTEAVVRPKDVAGLLHMHPQTINLMVKNGTFPIECIRSGNRTKIPRLKLMEFLGIKEE